MNKEIYDFYKSYQSFDTRNYYGDYLCWQLMYMYRNKFFSKENVNEMYIDNPYYNLLSKEQCALSTSA